MSKQIPLGNNLFATVDDEDFEILGSRKWYAVKPSKDKPDYPTYAAGWLSRKGENAQTKMDRMHILIMRPNEDQKVIHLDFDGLNNTRANLRVVSRSQAKFHRRPMSNNKSGAAGVIFDKSKKQQRKWRAYIIVAGKQIHLGNYASFDEALVARKAGEEKYYGTLSEHQPVPEFKSTEQRVLPVTWFKPAEIHSLSEINKEARTAICAICGPVAIRNGSLQRGQWKCVVKARAHKAKHRRRYNKMRDGARRPYRKHLKEQCERCGFIAEHLCQMDIHHRDYNAKNNDPSNLETLCSNCHRLETQMMRDKLFLTDPNPETKWVGARAKFGIKKGGGSANTSGVAGVGWKNEKKAWKARICVNGVDIHLGYFKLFDNAVAARKAAEIQYWGAASPVPEQPAVATIDA